MYKNNKNKLRTHGKKRNMTLKNCKRDKVLAILVILSLSLTMLLPTVFANTNGIVITDASVYPEVIRIGDTTRVTLTANNTHVLKRTPVNVMHLIDRSGTMGWYGEIIHNSSGTLTSDVYEKIDTFYIDSNISSFDVVLVRQKVREMYERLRIVDPNGVWFGRGHEPSGITHIGTVTAERIGVSGGRVKNGTWEVWARVLPLNRAPRNFTLAVQIPPIRIDLAEYAAKTFVGLMSNYDRIGVASFSRHASLDKGLTLLNSQANRDAVNNSICELNAGGATAIGRGICRAKGAFDDDDAINIIILLSDGFQNVGKCPRAEAHEAAGEGTIIFTVGFGETDRVLLQYIADVTGGKFHFAPSGCDLQEIYEDISEDIIAMTSRARAYHVLPAGVEYAGNATTEPDEIRGDTLIWAIEELAPYPLWTVSFDVRMKTPGYNVSVNMVPDSKVITECCGGSDVPFPALFVDVGAFNVTYFNISIPPEKVTIGQPIEVTGNITIDNIINKANVSVNLYINYPAMVIDKNIFSIKADGTMSIEVYALWIPTSSGQHAISIHVYELKDDGTKFWTEAQGLNNITINKMVNIGRVQPN